MKPISPQRFDALAGYARQAHTILYSEDLAAYEHANERVLGLLIMDKTDKDFGGIILALDEKKRYRAVHVTKFNARRRLAEITLRTEMERIAAEDDASYYQGDESGKPIDFFTPVVPEAKLNPSFVHLLNDETFSPARGIIEPMMRWYEDVDGNFIEQFQTKGFDARIWELYLFATFKEMGFDIERIHQVPDFQCVAPFGQFSVEATTANPTQDQDGNPVEPPPTDTEDQMKAYLRDYMPIKFGSALTSKLAKKYWLKENVQGSPFVLAIHDFSSPQSMTRTRSAFESYITGKSHKWSYDAADKLVITPETIEKHVWGTKEIPSGFFSLPEAENVSAVIFSNSGTIAKFNRMGVVCGFGSKRVGLIRAGFTVNHDPHAHSPTPFKHFVNSPEYEEHWSESLDVWHNPNALIPLDPRMLPYAGHHQIKHDGQVVSMTPDWHPLSSRTLHFLDDKLAEGSG